VVTAQPIRTSQLSYLASAAILIIFVVVALVMPHANAGAHFTWKDQLGTGVLGVIIAGAALLPTRPRLRADAEGVSTRAYLGPFHHIPWDLVVDVQFPDKLRFARLVLPGDETIALYAVQRVDRENAVRVMRELRELHAQSGKPVAP
jgi:hypothetical protein